MRFNSDRKRVLLQVWPWGIQVEAFQGEKLIQALQRGGIYFKNPCEGKGSCEKCRVEVEDTDQEGHYQVLACKASVDRDLLVKVPSRMVMED